VGHSFHPRTEGVWFLDGLNRLDWLKMLSRLNGDNGICWLRSGGDETRVCGGGRGSLEVIEIIICKGVLAKAQAVEGKRTIKRSGRLCGLRWGKSRHADRRRKGRPTTKSIIVRKAKQVDLLSRWFGWRFCGYGGALR